MKRRLLLFQGMLLILLLSGGAIAQRGLHLGLRVMPQYTALLNADDSKADDAVYKAKLSWGFAFGFSSMYALNNHLSFGTNLLYSSQGQQYTYQYATSGNPVTVTNRLQLRYVKMPILARYSTDATQKSAFFVEGGVQPGWLISTIENSNDKRFVPLPPTYITYNLYPDRMETLNKLLLAGVLGAGGEFKLRYNVKLNLQIRVEYGFTDVEDKTATFTQSVQGEQREALYYETPRDRAPQYAPGRPATHAFATSLCFGLDYVFIPRFRP